MTKKRLVTTMYAIRSWKNAKPKTPEEQAPIVAYARNYQDASAKCEALFRETKDASLHVTALHKFN